MQDDEPRGPPEDGSPVGSPPTCIFCARLSDPALADRRIFEDGAFHVSHQLAEDGPTYLGLALIQTKRHVPNLGSLTEPEAARLGLLLHRVSRVV